MFPPRTPLLPTDYSLLTLVTDPAQNAFTSLFGPEFGHGKAFDLSKLRGALDKLGAPHRHLPPVIHVAGTNGKGSTIAFMRAITEAAGLRVHAFTKPHLFELSERFLVSGAPAATELLVETAQRIAGADATLTQFDAQVAAAFLMFSATPADLCLIETGLGGRDDSTNVIERPRACVLTPIGLDHQDVLGASLAEIAAHKAGILKSGAVAVVARQADAAAHVIEAAAQRIGASLFREGVEWDVVAQRGRLVVQTETRVFDLDPPVLEGPHQTGNAGLAVAALLAADIAPLDDATMSAGLRNARWAGRLQPITRGALAAGAEGAEVWVDGGHNAHAAQALVHALAAMDRKRPARTALVIGLRTRKDWRAFIDTLAASAAFIAAVPLEDGVAPGELAQHARARGVEALEAQNVEQAVAQASGRGARRILVCGSLLLAAQALAAR